MIIKCQKSVSVETDVNTKRQDGLNDNQDHKQNLSKKKKDHKQKKQTTHYKSEGLARVKERKKVRSSSCHVLIGVVIVAVMLLE